MVRPEIRRDETSPIEAAEIEQILSGLMDVGGPILVAVSGGPDSTALMHFLARWATPARPQVVAATVDHGLRPESRAEAGAVSAQAERIGLAHHVLTWTPDHTGAVSQEAARAGRYALLETCARALGASHLATAHTLDDQAETILMRMAAGSGLSGLGGMRPDTDRGGLRHVRPLLGVPKARLIATCAQNGWHYADDPSNREPRFARARWRKILPGLAAEGLDSRRIAACGERLRRADLALETLSAAVYHRLRGATGDGDLTLDGGALAREPTEIALRVLALALRDSPAKPGVASPTLRLQRLESCHAAVAEAVSSGTSLRRTLGGRMLAVDRSGRITIAAEPLRRRGSSDVVVSTPHSLGIHDSRA